MVALSSSMMAEAEYDAAARILRIRFHSGGWYRYFGVPPAVYGALLAAPSHGRFFHAHIDGRFRYARE